MRAYLIEDLEEEQFNKVEAALKDLGFQGPFEGIYFLPVPDILLDAEQQEHSSECGPYVLGLETEPGQLKMELLIRARNRIRCSCVKYAEPKVREHMVEYLDRLLTDLGIAV